MQNVNKLCIFEYVKTLKENVRNYLLSVFCQFCFSRPAISNASLVFELILATSDSLILRVYLLNEKRYYWENFNSVKALRNN